MKKRRKHITVLILLLLLASSASGYRVARHMQRHLQYLDEQITEKDQQLAAAAAERSRNQIYLEKWRQISVFQQESPAERQTTFTAYLQSLQTKSNIRFELQGEPRARPMEENGEFEILSFILRFPANLENLVDFLHELDASGRLLRVESLKISRRPRPAYSEHFMSDLPGTIHRSLQVEMTVAIPAAVAQSPSVIGEPEGME